MAIVISGVNNNDKITASDGTIDLLSGVNYAGIITAPAFTTPGNITAGHLNIGSGIQLGNSGVATATTFVGNLTGNVNATSNLLLQIGGSEKFRVASSGQLGIGGANYGTSGQVLTSGGSGSAATWSTIPTPDADKITEGNTEAEVIDTGSDGHFKVTTEGSERFRITSDGKIGIGNIASPVNNVEIRTDAHGEGVTIKSTGNTSNALTFDANRGTQGVIGVVYGRWNGTTVGQMSFVSGDDGTDKNDGYITFGTESAASNGNVNATERLRITSAGKVGINQSTWSGKDHIFEVKQDTNDKEIARFTVNGGDGSVQGKGFIGLSAFNSTTYPHAYIGVEEYGTSHYEGHLTFATRNASNDSVPTERLRITSTGILELERGSAVDQAIEIKTTSTTGASRIRFVESGTAKAQIAYSHGNDQLEIIGATGNAVAFFAGGTERLSIDSNGHMLPSTNDAYDLGSSSLRWRNVYTTDLQLSNKGKTNDVDNTWGDYTIQEGESDLFLINNRSGKKYVFLLKEVS